MSADAMAGLFRLQIGERISGTAMSVLQYLCYRHDDRKGYAWPGLQRISRDLCMSKGRVFDAIVQLESVGLVRKRTGVGRRSNSYELPWLSVHLLDRESRDPIIWPTPLRSEQPDHKQYRSGNSDHKEIVVVGNPIRSGRETGAVAVGNSRHKNENNKKPPACAEGRAGETDWKSARQQTLDALGLDESV